MNLLISAYACAPHLGSEHAVGWTWVTGARRLGHRVWAMASTVHREAILQTCAHDPVLADIEWVFPEVSWWPLRPGVEPHRERTYNLLWQIEARRHGQSIVGRERIDVIHHASWAGIRAPSFLGDLGPPLVIGPIGGGETSPPGLRDCIGIRGRALEYLRDLSNVTITLNPAVRPGLQRAALLFVSTAETKRLFTGGLRRKIRVFSQLSLPVMPPARRREALAQAPRFIFAGRLLYWKGVHIALRAFARLLHHFPAAVFTIVGDGPERARLAADVQTLRIAHAVEFLSRIPQSELFALYDRHDFLLFPSLHDSGGMAVLEAMARGLPPVCLDLGGPRLLVTEPSGLVIRTLDLNTDDVAAAMCDAIHQAIEKPGRLEALSAGAITRALQFKAETRAELLYGEIEKAFRTPTQESSRPHAQIDVEVATDQWLAG